MEKPLDRELKGALSLLEPPTNPELHLIGQTAPVLSAHEFKIKTITVAAVQTFLYITNSSANCASSTI